MMGSMMRRPCDVETVQDFQRYYTGFMGLQMEENLVVPAKLYRLQTNQVHMIPLEPKTHIWMPPIALSWEALKERGHFGIPKVGMVNLLGEVVYGSLKAERNSHRGLSLERIKFYDFNHWYLRHKYGAHLPVFSPSVALDILEQVFAPKYLSFGEAWSQINTGMRVGVKLSPDFALYSLPSKLYPLVAYKKWTIGFAPSQSEIRVPSNPDFIPQLRELFNVYAGG